MENELRILLLEDVGEEAKLIERIIQKDRIPFSCRRVDSREQFSAALTEFNPHLVLSDHALPQFNSIEALKLARTFDPSIPFILVTGTVSEEFAVACLKQGANDYVLKSNLSRLPSAIKQALTQREAQEKKKIAEEELQEQNIKLSLSNQELRKRNAELDSFVYSVSHNLRGPLSSILGLVNLSRLKGPCNPAELFNRVEDCVKRLDETLKDIIECSRNTRTEIAMEEVDLEQLFFSNCEKLKYLSNTGDLKFTFRSMLSRPVYSDSSRIGLIMHNIISNAVKYCDDMKSDKFMKLTVAEADHFLSLCFEDNGVGIPEAVLPEIFKMFYRGNQKSDGAGLGLYIVKEAVDKLNGSIKVNSTVGNGTTIKIEIPVHAA